MAFTFSQPARWLDQPIRILLVGVGGNGSEMLDALARMHLSLKALGHPHGLDVTAIDPDDVSESNIVRQRFYVPEIGQNKALTAVQRHNLYLGLEWDAYGVDFQTFLDSGKSVWNYDLVIGCLDSVAGRKAIADQRDYACRDLLYLDLGNGTHSGQAVLGHLIFNGDTPFSLPIAHDLFPELLTVEDEDDRPSCSAEESLRRQNFGVNRTMATLSANLLWSLFTQPAVDHHGFFMDARHGSVQPLRIDPELWESLSGQPWICHA